jgi:hypothetical protein
VIYLAAGSFDGVTDSRTPLSFGMEFSRIAEHREMTITRRLENKTALTR